MPIFNRAHIVEETLQSIIGQSYKHWECIIVDDSSNDNTYKRVSELIANDNRFKLFERPKNKTRGASSCRNYGISKTSGEFIQFFDSDDIMHPKHLERKINIIDDHDLVICKVQYFSGQFSDQFKDSTKDLEYKTNIFKAFIKDEFPMCMVAPMWRKFFLLQFLPINEELKMLIDREFHTRILFENPSYVILNENLVFYRNDMPSINNNFNKTVDAGLSSILQTYSLTLQLNSDEDVTLHILNKVIDYFRKSLSQKNYEAARNCLKFTKENTLWISTNLKLKRMRIFFFFRILEIVKRGETRFNYLFKL